MKEKMKNMVEFAKTHKKDIAIGVTTAVVGVVLLKKSHDDNKAFVDALKKGYEKAQAETAEKIAKLDWKLGKMTDLWDEGGYTNSIVNDIPIAKLGELGNEFKKIEGVTDETITSIVIGFTNNTEI